MLNLKEKFLGQSIRTKILLAIGFGCLVLFFSWGISRVLFRKTLITVNRLTQPNHKLALVNNLFQKISRPDEMQNLQELRDYRNPYQDFLPQPPRIIQTLDSLKALCRNNPGQLSRIDTMKNILRSREQLFAAYLKYRSDVIYNRSLSRKIQDLSNYIRDNINNTDSSVVTKQEKTTTTVVNENSLPEPEKQQSFFKRLFHKKKSQEAISQVPKTITTEDLKITIDTISVAQRDTFIQNIEAAVRDIDKEGRSKVSQLLKKEFELYTTGNLFVSELQTLLHEIQNEEYAAMQVNTLLLGREFNTAAVRIGIMLLVFFIVMGILVYLIFSDISKSNRYKEQLVIAKKKAEQSEQVKQRFLANMSHELRTPLQSIIGFSEQLKEKDIPEKKTLDIIHRSSEYLLQIVNEVLDYSRIVSGKFVIEKQDFDIRELVAEVADAMDLQAESKNIRFLFRADLGGTAVYSGDAFRLKQILYNLLGNAIKFTNSGEVSFSVIAKDLSIDKSEFTFEVKDTGIGIEPEQLKNIFNAFEQASDSTQRLYGGTGLGLGIAKSLAEIQGGSIAVSSEKGEGSCFTVTLSYLKSAVQAGAEQESLATGDRSFKGKILVVDDDAFIVQLCSTILDKQGLDYITYFSPQEVLANAWDDAITLVLLDIRLPGMPGTELCRRLKKIAAPGVTFVALTAQALPEERSAILQQGFSDILLKPFREKDLLKLIYRHDFNAAPAGAIDLQELEAMCMYDAGLIRQALDLFLTDTEKDLHDLKAAAAAGKYKKVREACHRLSAKTGQVGATQLSLLLKTWEKQSDGKTGNVNGISASEIYSALTALIENIRQYRQQFEAKPQYHT